GLCQSVEDVFAGARGREGPPPAAWADVLVSAVDAIGGLLSALESPGQAAHADIAGVRRELRLLGRPVRPGTVHTWAAIPAAGPAVPEEAGRVAMQDPSLSPAGGATVRVAMSKLEAHLTDAETMLAAKLA